MSSTNDRVSAIFKLEQQVVELLNLQGWKLKHTGDSYLPYDALGYTPKGQKCIVEMKFRDTYYETKILEVFKFNKLRQFSDDILKFYYVSDPKGSYWYLINNLDNLQVDTLYCPKSTMWDNEKQNKSVFLLKESQAIAKYNHYATT